MNEDTPKSAEFVAPRAAGPKPTVNEMQLIQQLTRELAKHGNFRIRFVERVEEEVFPTLLVSVSLPRGMQAGDPEVFKLHEIAHQISALGEIDVLITTSGMSGRGRRLEYETSEVAMNIGADLLNEVPNFHACEALLRSSMRGLSKTEEYSDIFDVLNNLSVAARLYFYMGHRGEALRILAKQEEILSMLAAKSENENYDYSLVYPEFNEAALLYAMVGEFEKASALVDLNYAHLQKFVEKNVFVKSRSDAEDYEARKLYSELPADLTFSRQEMREKILFYKESFDAATEQCEQLLTLADEPFKRFLHNK
ncbi:MAG: hypothetical protein K2Y39_20105 [Candidatus Obscuribacterales bacterium]|nr:hypothetical protein [Candidatus Obscuribacterales bacterium]